MVETSGLYEVKNLKRKLSRFVFAYMSACLLVTNIILYGISWKMAYSDIREYEVLFFAKYLLMSIVLLISFSAVRCVFALFTGNRKKVAFRFKRRLAINVDRIMTKRAHMVYLHLPYLVLESLLFAGWLLSVDDLKKMILCLLVTIIVFHAEAVLFYAELLSVDVENRILYIRDKGEEIIGYSDTDC